MRSGDHLLPTSCGHCLQAACTNCPLSSDDSFIVLPLPLVSKTTLRKLRNLTRSGPWLQGCKERPVR